MRRQTAFIAGGLLLLVGLLSLARALGAAWADMERLWPIVALGGGALAIRQGARERSADRLWLGVTVTASSACFAYIVLLQGGWGVLTNWWPIFVGIAGVGWLAAWLVERQQAMHLVLALVSFLAACALLAITHGLLTGITLVGLKTLWPWLLVLAGLALVGVTIWREYADRD